MLWFHFSFSFSLFYSIWFDFVTLFFCFALFCFVMCAKGQFSCTFVSMNTQCTIHSMHYKLTLSTVQSHICTHTIPIVLKYLLCIDPYWECLRMFEKIKNHLIFLKVLLLLLLVYTCHCLLPCESNMPLALIKPR